MEPLLYNPSLNSRKQPQNPLTSTSINRRNIPSSHLRQSLHSPYHFLQFQFSGDQQKHLRPPPVTLSSHLPHQSVPLVVTAGSWMLSQNLAAIYAYFVAMAPRSLSGNRDIRLPRSEFFPVKSSERLLRKATTPSFVI
ncbi:hypothetical protein KSP40_PGU006945 [Platanthera guangdongensis]|uniref:Uncharacterized protein n=1 Tax=Platanthera guangdongensis TaxID=2320717 RepID=A0ABR2N4F9_9ASPA